MAIDNVVSTADYKVLVLYLFEFNGHAAGSGSDSLVSSCQPMTAMACEAQTVASMHEAAARYDGKKEVFILATDETRRGKRENETSRRRDTVEGMSRLTHDSTQQRPDYSTTVRRSGVYTFQSGWQTGGQERQTDGQTGKGQAARGEWVQLDMKPACASVRFRHPSRSWAL